ncbi:MAG: transcription elongation factor GreA [Clostridia bacterium]|nr:transcription elongation factor GreA [Clostridia bacterium]
MANEKVVLTRDGRQKLLDELEFLQTVERPKVQEEIQIAKGFGDLSENAEYSAAREHQARVEGRIQELQQKLDHAVIVEDDAAGSDVAAIGCFVRVFDMEYEEEDTYKLVGATEADPKQLFVSNESPIGAALIGVRVGEIVDVETPGGLIKLKILEITR